jgi:hypothetical protein
MPALPENLAQLQGKRRIELLTPSYGGAGNDYPKALFISRL